MIFAPCEMQVTSSAFSSGGGIPRDHTGEGRDVSPALQWDRAPEGTLSFAVVCHDPDAPVVNSGSYGFTHWVLYNLPGSCHRLDEATAAGTAGVNDFGNTGYNGPMPPEGHGVHHYYFWVIALDSVLELDAGLTLRQLLAKVEPHVVGMNRLAGCYRRD